MPTVLAHPLVAVSAWAWVRSPAMPRALLLLGAACTIAPDLDVVGLRIGVPYDSLLGHRGLSHSLPFAALMAGLITAFVRRVYPDLPGFRAFAFLFLCTASHGLLDALTSGGHGVAFSSPFSNERYFFPWRPIEVSPLSIRRFFSATGVSVLASELRWVAGPLTVFALVGLGVRQVKSGFALKSSRDRGKSPR
jgi:inner membrane protein